MSIRIENEPEGILLKKAGRDLRARCPIHEDVEALLVITPAKSRAAVLISTKAAAPSLSIRTTRAP